MRVSGLLFEPGVYRFSVYTSPVSPLPNGATLDSAAAEFLFSFDPTLPSDGEFSWHNYRAAVYRSRVSGVHCRSTYEAAPPTYPDIALASVVVRNNVGDWCMYE